VPVLEGHTESVVLKLKKKATVDEIKEVMRSYLSEAQKMKLPSAPDFA